MLNCAELHQCLRVNTASHEWTVDSRMSLFEGVDLDWGSMAGRLPYSYQVDCQGNHHVCTYRGGKGHQREAEAEEGVQLAEMLGAGVICAAVGKWLHVRRGGAASSASVWQMTWKSAGWRLQCISAVD